MIMSRSSTMNNCFDLPFYIYLAMFGCDLEFDGGVLETTSPFNLVFPPQSTRAYLALQTCFQFRCCSLKEY